MSSSPATRRSPRPALTVALLLATLLVGCPDGGEAPRDEAAELQEVRQEVVQVLARLEPLVQSPWLIGLAVQGPLTALHSRLHTWSTMLDARLEAAPESRSTFSQLGRQLLGSAGPGLEQCLQGLEAVAGQADVLPVIELRLSTLVGNLGIPEDQPFPLRARFREGYAQEKHEYLRMLGQGLLSTLGGRDDDPRYRIAAGNLERLAADGRQLLDALSILGREITNTDLRLRTLETRVEQATAILAKGRAAGVSETELAPLVAAHEAALKGLPGLSEAWQALRAPLANDPRGRQQDCTRLRATLDELQIPLVSAALPHAERLGLPFGR